MSYSFRILFCLLVIVLSRMAAYSQSPLLGFNTDHAAQERALEARFDAALRTENLRNWMQRLSLHPHHVGSPYDKENAEFIASQFRSWGYETQIERFDVLFPTPKSRLLEMTAPKRFRARLEEPSLKEDRTSGDRRDQLPPYNAYSADGDVTGEVVYVNYGIPKDYEVLESRGIQVKGKIVLARYGGSWRGIKPKVAAEHGAIGCLIYSDPRDDGFFKGDVYPKGAYRNAFGAQRGSVADMPLYSGDPLTPGIGATKEAPRLSLKEAKTLTKIPTLPISYADALPLLRELKGPVAPEEWRGALPLTYHLGPGPATVHLKLEFHWKQTPVYDVIARLPGTERPDEWILRGNHYDAWVFGAEDPLSGTVALMEEARAIGALAKSGASPKRTILYTVWDGEEPGLLGSTEWVETHAAELASKAALYVNSDSNGRGFLSAGGSHTLEKFLHQVALEVTDPEKGIPVAERARANRLLNGTPEVKKETRASGETHLSALGSGSDYTPFLQHLGIAALNLGYGGENGGGSYHSIYDSFDWYVRFGDPDFRYGIALAQTAGRVVLRAANADILPWQFTALSDTVEKYGKEITKLTDDLREETVEKNKAIAEKLYEATFDPTETHVAPKPETPVPALNFKPLNDAITHLKASARNADSALSALAAGGYARPREQLQALDALLIQTERAMLRNEGLPRRGWYRHQIYAPGFYTGYGVKTLPGIREAIEQREWKEAALEIPLVANTLESVAGQIDKISDLLKNP
jgi:N-acetylated-alpha-linked acidic dipeptidase